MIYYLAESNNGYKVKTSCFISDSFFVTCKNCIGRDAYTKFFFISLKVQNALILMYFILEARARS